MKIKKLFKAFLPYGFIVLYKRFKNKKEETEQGFEWRMTNNEKTLFKKYIKNSKIYLEFGSGGSTIAALANSTAKIYSVESSNDWINTMYRKYNVLIKANDSGRLNLMYVNIGAVGRWGVPCISNENDPSVKFQDYSQKIFVEKSETKSSDLILIDGRFRMACFFNVLLNTNENVIIMFHDFWTRLKYHIIMEYIEIIDGVDSLMVCRKKQNIMEKDIEKYYNEYKNNFE